MLPEPFVIQLIPALYCTVFIDHFLFKCVKEKKHFIPLAIEFTLCMEIMRTSLLLIILFKYIRKYSNECSLRSATMNAAKKMSNFR